MTSSLRRALASAACASLLLPIAACSLLDRGAGKEKGPTFPEAWDSRVLPYAELASELRGLEFEHPVTVEFQSPAEFEKGLAADESELDEEDREELENFAGMLRAMGLVHGEVDLFDEQDKLMTGGALAYYSYEDKLVRVRGTKITPAVKSTLVHELVHVLQDQVFDSGKRQKELAEADDSSGLVYDALVEGDARRIETKYAEQLKPAQRRALHRDEERQRRGATSAIKDVPEVLQTMMGAPYSLGEAMLAVATLDGEDEVDDFFRDPPRTEENLLDPFTFTEDEEAAEKVDEPSLGKGQKEFDSNTFEATGWLLTLAARIPLTEALAATDGWGGDRYVAYTEDGRSCVKVRYVADTDQDADQMIAALRSWVAAGPGGAARVDAEGGKGLLFTSCDPGTAERGSGEEHSDEALTLALSRTYITHSLIEDGMPTRAARCYATELVTHFTLAEIQSDDPSPALIARFREIAQGCVDG